MIGYIYLAIALLLFGIGLFIQVKKVTWLISGYNTLSKEEKEKYDIDKLCLYMGYFLYLLAAVWLLMAVAVFALSDMTEWITWAGMGAEGILIVGGIVFLNTDNRVMK
ncbi:MAG: DUF3784 domain-containing protein [Eubacteriales bacterium]